MMSVASTRLTSVKRQADDRKATGFSTGGSNSTTSTPWNVENSKLRLLNYLGGEWSTGSQEAPPVELLRW